MKKIKLFLFDLDGTLIDSKRDIADSVNHTMRVLGLAEIPHEHIYEYVGNGVTPLIQKLVEEAGGPEAFPKALEVFKAHYQEHLLDTTRPFPGVGEVLHHFWDIPKVVITNKSQGYSEKILKGLAMEPFFKGTYGGDTQFPKKPDPSIVAHLLKSFQVSPQETVIIGDSRVDMETGHNAHILTCAVTYGFRPRSELEAVGYDYLIENPLGLIRLFGR